VWVCGCVGVWVCGCVGVWGVLETAPVRMHIQEWRNISIRRYAYEPYVAPCVMMFSPAATCTTSMHATRESLSAVFIEEKM
jgi:hypothetical protein